MNWISYVFPRTVLRTSSKYNREIRLNEEKGKLKLLVNGSRQSGEYIERLWKDAFKKIEPPPTVHRILVLGVGGGTVIKMLHDHFPDAKITAVDIDQTMIDIGKKYFGLDKIDNLALVCEAAEKYVRKMQYFDFIIIDLFIGTHIPEVVRDETFLKNIKKLLNREGSIVVNYLNEFGYVKKSEELKKRLESIFSEVRECFTHNNRFFAAS